MNDENGMRPWDLGVDISIEKNNKGEDIVVVRTMHGVTRMVISFTRSTSSDASTWRGIRTFGVFLALIYMLEEEYCSDVGSSTARSCDRFPFALLTFFSCLGDSLVEWFCVLFALVTLRTFLVMAKVEYLCYRAEQIAHRTSMWDYFVKYGYRHHLFDKSKQEETIVQRTTRIANQIAQEIWRSVRENTFVLVERVLPFFWVFRFVLRLTFCVLGTLLAFTGMIMFWAIAVFLAYLLGVLYGAILVFVGISDWVLNAAIRGMLGVVLLITLRGLLQFQFFINLTISLVHKILHF
jgi:hypothetical protein